MSESNGFQKVLDHIRSTAGTEAAKGRQFERLMKKYLMEDPVYKERFSQVRLYSEWAKEQAEFDSTDMGIDLVAEERGGGYCAIQSKCHAPETRISKPALDSFVSASAREPFTSRMVIDTGAEWGPIAKKTIEPLKPSCTVIHYSDLASRPVDWPDLAQTDPEELSYRHEPFKLYRHQEAALHDVKKQFEKNDRGKLIMACGTGKTFTALRIAEDTAGIGGRVLYLVPSISLFSQSMREWATQKNFPQRYVGICSDTRAGKNDEDASMQELEIPVTTDPEEISRALKDARQDVMTVVFCTYQSLGLVARAQDEGAPAFDIVLCDEAHRTTGVDRPGDKTSPFVLVHDKQRIRARKRLYMTATPRLYTAGAKAKAAHHDVEVFSMDDPDTFGPEFHQLPFSRAVDQDLLSDYKVVVFAMSEQFVDTALQAHLAEGDSEINITDAAKIIGCWSALQNPENKDPREGPLIPLTRAIAFTNTIASSKRLQSHWNRIIEHAIESLPDSRKGATFHCETQHVDGQHHALDRKSRIEWLKEGSGESCRILSNARCLSEGIDVPALDAVLFMNPRNSHVDIVQAVGRVMRKSEGKRYGYIILPIAVPAGVDPAEALNDNERFATVWSVLRALRSHDDRFNAEINHIDLNNNPTDRIIFSSTDGAITETPELPFQPVDLPPGAIYAKVVEKCGDRKYWESWAKDVGEIFLKLVHRIKSLLANPQNATLNEWFDNFHDELKVSINDSIQKENAIDMMAQHLLTRPVFEALFEHYDFAASNPVAMALDKLQQDFAEFGLENETRDLDPFYESVRHRARGLDNSNARQRVLMELYEKFFTTALKKDADRLGIVYTPEEIVDFILNSADHVLREEFGRSLSDEGVHVLDPFTGAGTFLVRLLKSDHIKPSDLSRKYHREFHANEIVLLAYYIAAIHIEEAYHGRRRKGSAYEPFDGIVLTDTFNLHTGRKGFPKSWLPDNSQRVERQQDQPIQVIVGNPPWSVGQRSAADDNPNVDYPELESRVSETYAKYTKTTNKNSLYDTYKMAIRWASDRIGKQGVIAFVSNGSWIDGIADSGVRACLAEEFSSIYVLHLRGNQRTQGERSRREGGKVFGQGSRAPVAITLLVRNPLVNREDHRIFYHDIGDYLKREEKLAMLRNTGSIAGIKDWQTIMPDRHHDWMGQRNEAFQRFFPMGSKEAKAGKADEAIFELYSRGLATGKDAYLYNFSHDTCLKNAQLAIKDYQGAMHNHKENPNLTVDQVSRLHSSHIRWDQELKNNLKRKKEIFFELQKIKETQYRPFVKQFCFVEYNFITRKYQLDRVFPHISTKNRAICVPGIGSTTPFSVLMVDSMPDLGLISASQCFPRYQYLKLQEGEKAVSGLEQASENITNTALRKFCTHYQDDSITKDQIFDYVYGFLHSPDFRDHFANDLVKELPRIPFATDFHSFAQAGHNLATLHLGYETCVVYPLTIKCALDGEARAEYFRIGHQKMRFLNDEKTILRINEHVSLHGIPATAHRYQVNGKTPLEWFIDRYRITKDKHSGIVNDPNAWFKHPQDLVTAIQRIVHVSVETTRIVDALPEFNLSDADAR